TMMIPIAPSKTARNLPDDNGRDSTETAPVAKPRRCRRRARSHPTAARDRIISFRGVRRERATRRRTQAGQLGAGEGVGAAGGEAEADEGVDRGAGHGAAVVVGGLAPELPQELALLD